MLRRLQGLQNMVRCAARARTGGIALGSGVAPKLHREIAAQRLAPPLAEPNELCHLGFSVTSRLVRRRGSNGRVGAPGLEGGGVSGRDRLKVSGGLHSVLSALVSGSSNIGDLERRG